MAYKYDVYGWYTGTAAADKPRTTLLDPGNPSETTVPGELRANWTGYAWQIIPYALPAEPAAQPEEVPRTVEMLWFLLAVDDVLNATESDIDAAIAAMPAGKPKRKMRAWMDHAATIERRSEMLNDAQALMGWTNAQIKDVFVRAATLARRDTN